MNKIDFHVLKHPIYPRDVTLFQHQQAVIHRLDGIKNHIGQGRALGFQLGNSKYLSFFDDDDSVIPDHIGEIIQRLDDDDTLSGIVTCQLVTCNGVTSKKHVPLIDRQLYTLKTARHYHQLIVLRRDVITTQYIDLLNQCNAWSEFALFVQMIMDGHKLQHIDRVCYNWNIHDKSSKSLNIKPSLTSINMIRTMMCADIMTQQQYDLL